MKANRLIVFVFASAVLTAGAQGLQAQARPNVLF